MPRAKRVRQIFLDASEPDAVQEIPAGFKRWLLTVWMVRKSGEIMSPTNFYFWSDVKTIGEAFELLHANGFACVQKHHNKITTGKLEVRLSMGEL